MEIDPRKLKRLAHGLADGAETGLAADDPVLLRFLREVHGPF
jgi:hypothetical protein